MARIPYVGVQSPFGNRGPDKPAPMNADTRGVTNGMEAATSAVMGLGGQAVDYFEKKRKDEEETALIDFEVKSSELENELFLNPDSGAFTQRGQNAIGVRERTMEEYDAQASTLMDGMPESVKQRAVLLDKRRRMQLEKSLFQHEARETDKYNMDQAVSGIESAVNNAGLYAADSERVSWEAGRAEVYANKLADLRGDGPDAESRMLEKQKAVSAVYEMAIDRKIKEDPYEADRFLSENQGKLTALALISAREKVEPYVKAAEYDTIASGIVSGAGSRAPGDFGSLVESVLETEGGYNASDGNSNAPVNFGINQKANPDIDVKNLSRDGAKEIYRERYWNAAGIDSAPASVRGQMFDTAVNMGVDTAKSLLKKSGGDPAKFAELRRQRYQDIVAKDPSQAKYLKSWLARVDKHEGSSGFEPPKSASDAVSIVRQTVTNPRDRRELESRVRFEFQLKEEAEREQKQEFAMSAYDRIMKSDGSATVEQMFKPDELRDAYKFGYLDNFRELQRQKALGSQPKTDQKLFETFKREAVLSPETFAKRNIMAVSARLETDDLMRLMGWQKDLNKPMAGQPDFIPEQKQLGMAYMDMGIDGEKKATKRKEFEASYYKEVEALVKSTGKKPSQQDRQEIINRMKLPFVREGWFSDDKVPAYKAEPGKDKIPEADRTRITADLRKAGITVTEQRIVETYLSSAGSDL